MTNSKGDFRKVKLLPSQAGRREQPANEEQLPPQAV
jgi:hypothetical protein